MLKNNTLSTSCDYTIQNTTVKDQKAIYALFEQAITYIKRNNYVGWKTYDKSFINKDIQNQLQFKIVANNQILGVFSICLEDILIWRTREKGDAVYLHRIVVNPKYKGQKQFQKILDWTTNYAHRKGLQYIRMDTWAANPSIIAYYKTFGFAVVDTFTTPDIPDLPTQHRNLEVALLELTLLRESHETSTLV
ncbi:MULTISPECIES: GNAT family N-acetyltransferase [Flavobacterium]|uniref:GNAT family N-acetyltransferase n=1 Tax=Flavobacterium sedimenticola TaxID=3043286 RepID=A0ABT6XQ63_9FLAO|nr:GNAT family N-acetyltransferase [Flavobacterium sedimenticola]MDI9256804.1 GNAT family N-acetyltransferase [Flavobacterium sedimenticola]